MSDKHDSEILNLLIPILSHAISYIVNVDGCGEKQSWILAKTKKQKNKCFRIHT